MSASDRRFTRRRFLVTGAAAAGYALAARPVSARAIRTDGDGLVTGLARIPSGEIEMQAYYARPDVSAPAPVVLVVHEIFGLHEYIRDVCRRLAKEGYFAVAPDLYQRHGDVTTMGDIDQILSEVVSRVSDAQVLADLDATLAWAGQQAGSDASRVAITGFCWGGRVVWLYAAHNPGLDAGAAWYGRLQGAQNERTPKQPIDLADGRLAPVVGLYGEQDRGISPESVFEMRQKLAAHGQSSQIVLFPAAPHGFHADYRESYRPLAAAEGWRRMLAWFREHGVG